jgi:hypothetical protein
LDWRTKVELYEQIRREYEFGSGSIIGVSRKLGVHRRTVREAVRSALPARRKKTERPHLKIAPEVEDRERRSIELRIKDGIDLGKTTFHLVALGAARQGDCAEEVHPEAASGLYRERPGISDWT